MSDRQIAAWSLAHIVEYYDSHRKTPEDIYPSEWVFLKDRLVEGMSLLDIGCAQGGFSGIVEKFLKDFSYTGVDLSPSMIEKAKERHPQHSFYVISNNNLSRFSDRQFDLVLCLGILHLNVDWRPLIHEAWEKTGSNLILDLRISCEPTLENSEFSYMIMDAENDSPATRLPYNVINIQEAIQTLDKLCPGHNQIQQFGYWHPVSGDARSPHRRVLMTTFCVTRDRK